MTLELEGESHGVGLSEAPLQPQVGRSPWPRHIARLAHRQGFLRSKVRNHMSSIKTGAQDWLTTSVSAHRGPSPLCPATYSPALVAMEQSTTPHQLWRRRAVAHKPQTLGCRREVKAGAHAAWHSNCSDHLAQTRPRHSAKQVIWPVASHSSPELGEPWHETPQGPGQARGAPPLRLGLCPQPTAPGGSALSAERTEDPGESQHPPEL